MDDWYRIADNEIHVAIKVVPNASKTELVRAEQGYLRVRVAAAPEDGKANAELIAYISKAIGCSKRELILSRGEKSRHKTLVAPLSYRIQLETLVKKSKKKYDK